MKTKRRQLSEHDFETKLARLLERRLDPVGGAVHTFNECGVLTNNRGLVVALANGQEFQLTIVESTRRY